MTEFARLRFEGGYDPLPEMVCATRIPLSSCITVVGPTESLSAIMRTPIPEQYALGTSPYPEDQPPDPLTLFPAADPQKQLQLFSLAARFRAATRDQVSNVYKRANYLPAHRLYSQAVLLALEQRSGDPPGVEQLINRITKLFPRGVEMDEYYPPKLRRWQVLETMTKYWDKGPARPIVNAWRRSHEIIPPPVVPSRRKNLANLRTMRLAKAWQDAQEAYEKSKEAQRAADEAQLRSFEAYNDGAHLVQSVGKAAVDNATATYRHDRQKAPTSGKAKKSKPPLTVKGRVNQIMQEAIVEARNESRLQLQQLDGDELAKGIIDLALFPDITDNQPNFGPGALNTFILNATTFRMNAARRLRCIEGLPSEYLAINSLLLLRGKPVYWRDLAHYFGVSREHMERSFGTLRQVFSEANQNLVLKVGPGMPKPKEQGQLALCLNPRVRIVDMRREHEPDKVPQRVYSVLLPTERKPRKYSRMRGRRYQERQRQQPAWAQKQYPED